MVARARNTATSEDCKVVLLGRFKSLDLQSVSQELDDCIETFGALMRDILLRTHRPTKVVLAQAAVLAWDVSLSNGTAFANKLVDGFSLCRKLSGSSSTGVKLPPGKRKVVMQLKKLAKLAKCKESSPRRKAAGTSSIVETQSSLDAQTPAKSSLGNDDDHDDAAAPMNSSNKRKALFQKLVDTIHSCPIACPNISVRLALLWTFPYVSQTY
jgi:hypothetical protein